MTDLRIGHGYDVHRLTEGRRLVLGGVEIPWDLGLLGHSDADVLTHAVMDALCGAAKLGDIGKLFPDSDPRYAGISSLELLRQVAALLKKGGWAVVNVDATLIAQAPKVGPCRREMEANLAAVLGLIIFIILLGVLGRHGQQSVCRLLYRRLNIAGCQPVVIVRIVRAPAGAKSERTKNRADKQ